MVEVVGFLNYYGCEDREQDIEVVETGLHWAGWHK